MSIGRRYLFLWTLLVAAGVPVFVGNAAAQTECAKADELRRARLFEDARRSYIALLKETPELGCAREGIQEIAAARNTNPAYELGRAYEAAGKYGRAYDSYAEALRLDPTCSDVREALARVDEPPTDEGDDQPFAEARALADLGD